MLTIGKVIKDKVFSLKLIIGFQGSMSLLINFTIYFKNVLSEINGDLCAPCPLCSVSKCALRTIDSSIGSYNV